MCLGLGGAASANEGSLKIGDSIRVVALARWCNLRPKDWYDNVSAILIRLLDDSLRQDSPPKDGSTPLDFTYEQGIIHEAVTASAEERNLFGMAGCIALENSHKLDFFDAMLKVYGK
jgi:hypothetical protein